MDKVKSILNKVLTLFKTAPIVKAIAVWIVLLIVLAFAVDKLLMPIFSGHFASTGEVPNLEGLSQEAAEKALDSAGFKYEWLEEGRYSAQIPEGLVLVQMPAAGRTAKLGRTVKLTKSMGLREVEIPDLRGKSQKQASISLSRAGLVQGAIVKGAHQSIPRGVVIRTIPFAGQKVRVGDTVKVVISAGATQGKTLLPAILAASSLITFILKLKTSASRSARSSARKTKKAVSRVRLSRRCRSMATICRPIPRLTL